MVVSIEPVEGLRHKITMTIEKEQLHEKYQKKLEEMQPKIQHKGFRNGKVPIKLARQLYGKDIWREIAREQSEKCLMEAIARKKLRLAAMPIISDWQGKFEQPIQLTAEFDTLPDIVIKPIDDLAIEQSSCAINDEIIDKAIHNLQKQQCDWQESDIATLGDRLTIGTLGYIDNKPIKYGKLAKITHILGSNDNLPAQFDQILTGVKKDQTKEVSISYPDDYRFDQVKGKTVVFKITVNKIETPILLDHEALIKKLAIIGGIDGLRDMIKDNVQEELDTTLEMINKQKITDTVLALYDYFPLPKILIDAELDKLRQQNSKTPFHTESTEEHSKLEKQAKKRVALGLLIGELANYYGIKASEEQLLQTLKQETQNFPNPQEVMQWYMKQPSRMQVFQGLVLENLVISKIKEKATITETPTDYNTIKTWVEKQSDLLIEA